MIDPWEAVMIGAILLVLFLWGPQKIPELARAVGEAKRELEMAGRGEHVEKELSDS